MATQSYQRIRMALGTGQEPTDIITEATPSFHRAGDVGFEFALYFGDTLCGVTNIFSLLVELKDASDRDGAALMQAEIYTFDTTLDAASWTDGSKQHAVVHFTAAQTALAMSGANSRDLWCVVSALTTDVPAQRVVWGAFAITLQEAGISASPAPPVGDPLYYTAAECDARFQPKRDSLFLTKTADYLVTTDDSGDTFSIAGALALVTFTLPAAAAGLEYRFLVTAATGLKVQAAAGDNFVYSNITGVAAGYCKSTTIGDVLHIVAINSATWFAMPHLGTWEIE